MNSLELREKALAIAARHPFKEPAFISARCDREESAQESVCASNHIDKEFMAFLDEGHHLDINLLPI